MNVWELGLNAGWPGEITSTIAYGGLASRLLDVSTPDTWCVQSTNPNYWILVGWFGGNRGYGAISTPTVPNLTPHFPYGRIVVPDSHA